MTEPKQKLSIKIERILGILAILAIAAAWIIGFMQTEADVIPSLKQAIPEAARFESLGNKTYAAWSSKTEEKLLGYIKISSGKGYGGPMLVAVAVNRNAELLGISVADSKETPSYFKRVLATDFIKDLTGKSYQDKFVIGKDVDAVTGATRTSEGLVQASQSGIRDIAEKQLNLKVPEKEKIKIKFGIPEIVLICLYIVGIVGRLKNFKQKKMARWVSIVVGLLVIGFIYDNPLTISMINQVLLGFLPQWQTNIYWFLLIGGIVVFFIFDKTNPYCNWFCPFGAAQECLGLLGKAKPRSAGSYRTLLKWMQRLLALAAIVIALIFRNPGLSSYEVFGTLFELVGSTIQFLLLGIVLVASLFILRPWCNYLCPVRPVDHFFRMLRKWIRESWKRLRIKAAN